MLITPSALALAKSPLLLQQDLVMTVPHSFPFSYKHHGATLVELIITIVIISVALTGILSVVNLTVNHSADPLVQRQAIAIAESYIEEISLLPVSDPNGSNSGETRASFDNIDDYNGLSDVGAKNQNNTTIAGLENYTVTVSIANTTLSSVAMKAITVTVTRAGTDTISLTGYRANY